MELDPYAPPKSPDDVPRTVAPLPPELEMQAVRVLGEIGLGLIPAGVLGGLAGGGIAKGYVNLRKPAMIDAVSRQLGIPTGLFNPDKYLLR